MNSRPLTKEEIEAVWVALNMRANFIETGDITLSAIDLQNQKLTTEQIRNRHGLGVAIKALSVDQMKLVIRLRELTADAIKGRICLNVYE